MKRQPSVVFHTPALLLPLFIIVQLVFLCGLVESFGVRAPGGGGAGVDRVGGRGWGHPGRAPHPTTTVVVAVGTTNTRLHSRRGDAGTNRNTATLRLIGRTTVRSKKFPFGGANHHHHHAAPVSSFADLVEFFETPAHRNLLLSGGGKRECEHVDEAETSLLMEAWQRACVDVGASSPVAADDDNCAVVRVRTGGFRFPGLTLTSTAKIGVQLLKTAPVEKEDDDEAGEATSTTTMLRYEFVLIEDETTVSGAKPVVWIYDKLTGGGGGSGGGSTTTTRSLTTTTCQMVDDGAFVRFETDGYLSVSVEFPSVLLRIIPGGKSKAEERGGNTFRNVLEGDVKPAVQAFEDAYESWVRSRRREVVGEPV